MPKWVTVLGALTVLVACTPRTTTPVKPRALPSSGGASPGAVVAAELKAPQAQSGKIASAPIPVGKLTPAQTTKLGAARPALAQKLQSLSKVDFATARAELLSNNGDSLISSGNGGIIGSGNAGAIDPGKEAFRLLETSDEASLTALDGEEASTRIEWLDGTTTLLFFHRAGEDERLVELDGTGAPIYTKVVRVEPAAAGNRGLFASLQTLVNRVPIVRTAVHQLYDAKGNLLSSRFTDASINDPTAGIEIACERYEVDFVGRTSAFRLAYKNFGLVEEGNLTLPVLDGISAPVSFSVYDPLLYYEGEAEARKTDGTLLYKRKQINDGGKVRREVDLLNGVVLSFPDFKHDERGVVLLDGQPAGDVLAKSAVAAAARYTLTLWDDPGHPIEVSFGDEVVASSSASLATPAKYGMVHTLAGNGKPGLADESKPWGTGPAGQLNEPSALVAGAGNTLLVLDQKNKALRQVFVPTNAEPKTSITTIKGHFGSGIQKFAKTPRWMAPLTGDGALYFSEGWKVHILSGNDFLPFEEVIGAAKGYGDGAANVAQFTQPMGMVKLEDDSLLVADYGNSCIRKLESKGSGYSVTTFAGSQEAGYVDGPATQARFRGPFDLVLDGKGGVLVSDPRNQCIRRIDLTQPDHPVSTLAGHPTKDTRASDGPRETATFAEPYGLCVDSRGNAYVADSFAERIRRISPDGYVRTICGGNAGSLMDSPAKWAGLGGVVDVVCDADGRNVFLTEFGLHRVRWCQLDRAF